MLQRNEIPLEEGIILEEDVSIYIDYDDFEYSVCSKQDSEVLLDEYEEFVIMVETLIYR